ncbi:hypothetical protein CROQUDRAFT_22792, partial [Cronartium quercuum f. sp. fusiforme G11]
FCEYIDESGVKNMDVWRTRGWAKKGSVGACDLRNRENDHWTILPAVSEGGMIAAMMVKGPVEQVHVEMFLKRQLLPVMNPYPAPYSVLILDNAKIHHGDLIEELC